jgi:ABC-type phosphate transport system permease subunit
MTSLISPATSNRAAKVMLWVSASIAILTLMFILGYIVVQGLPVLTLSFLLESPRLSGAEGGILPAIVGTFRYFPRSLSASALRYISQSTRMKVRLPASSLSVSSAWQASPRS